MHLQRANDASTTDHAHLLRDGAVAGAVATVVSTLVMNVGVHAVGDAAVLAPGEIIERTQARLAVFALARTLGPFVLVVVPAFAAVGMLWGGVYGVWVEHRLARLPDWLSGLFFALLPLAVALVLVPLLVAETVSGSGPIGGLIVASEIVRHLVYGVVLGLTYPLRIARRSQHQRGSPRVPGRRGSVPVPTPAQPRARSG